MKLVDRLLRRAARSRPLVLGAALGAGLVLAAIAAPDHPPFDAPLVTQAVAAGHGSRLAAADPKDAAVTPPTDASEPSSKSRPAVDAEISISDSGVKIRKNRDAEKRQGGADDLEFQSFEEFVDKAPRLAALVFMVTALVFLMPLLILVLIIWYKVRSNRMRNETMLKLAERGAVSPGDAMAAMAPGSSSASLAALPSTAPLYEQAKQVRRRVAWSDLRKGVILLGIGLGLSLWSILDDGTANSVGLVMLFVGIGYIVLWHFEERQLTPSRDSRAGPPGGA